MAMAILPIFYTLAAWGRSAQCATGVMEDLPGSI
jgi:hypothetical protein